MTVDSLNLQSCGCFFILIRAGSFNQYNLLFAEYKMWHNLWTDFLYKAEQNLQLTF